MLQSTASRIAIAMALVVAVGLLVSGIDRRSNVDISAPPYARSTQAGLSFTGDQGAGPPTLSRIQIDSAPRSLPASLEQPLDSTFPDDESIDERIRDAQTWHLKHERLNAISMLGRSTKPIAELALGSLLDDNNPSIRAEAVEALGALGSDSAVQSLAYALSDDNLSIRMSAVEMLADIASDGAVSALTITLSDDRPVLRKAAVYELSEIDSAAAIGLLELFLSDNDRTVRQIAAERLQTPAGTHTEE